MPLLVLPPAQHAQQPGRGSSAHRRAGPAPSVTVAAIWSPQAAPSAAQRRCRRTFRAPLPPLSLASDRFIHDREQDPSALPFNPTTSVQRQESSNESPLLVVSGCERGRGPAALQVSSSRRERRRGESARGGDMQGLALRRSNGGRLDAPAGNETEPMPSDLDALGTQHLPTARLAEPSSTILSRSLKWAILLFVLQILSIVPAFFGTLYCARNVWTGPGPLQAPDGVGGVYAPRSTRLDYFAAGVWAFASGYWCWSVASGLLRRWLVYYEFIPAMVRLLSLQAIIWPSTRYTLGFVGWDQPLLGWIICAASAAASNTIQLYVTSNIRISASNKPASWSQGVPQLRASARKHRALNLRQAIVKTGMPLAVLAWATLPLLHWEVYDMRYTEAATTRFPPSKMFAHPSRGDLFQTRSDVRALVLVTSSWTERSFANRAMFRNSSLKLIPPPSPRITFVYRFVVGQAPSPWAQQRRGPALDLEMQLHDDVVVVEAADGYNALSRKMHAAYAWSSSQDFDFLLKTDDDMFVRFDTISAELAQLGKRRLFWKGLGYWNIPPIHDASNKNAAFDYDLPLFPPFTAGALTILSRDVVSLITADSAPRRYTQNEDQALGTWLYPFGIRLIHDRRIQQAQVCEDDMIAKHFGSQYKEVLTAVDMYENVRTGKKMCEGFLQTWCGICYPSCRGRSNHWRDWGFDCDDFKGITLISRPGDVLKQAVETPLRTTPDAAVIGGKDDPWIVPGLLSTKTSTFSRTDDWHLLRLLCWTTGAETFQERHWQTVETVWVHEPRAVIFMLSTSLPEDFFQPYTDRGYAIHVVRIGKDELIKMGWHLGPESREWLDRWEQWSTGPYFFSHLTDYLRFVFLFKYGGTYLDMDAPWVRSPPDSKLEFIGADWSTVASDVEWTLDDTGMYLAPGVMRFKSGWDMFREIAESSFVVGRYRPECFNCVGPRAITGYVKTRRRRLEEGGLTILPSKVLYPKNWVHAEELVQPKGRGEARKELEAIIEGSWSIHLFGKMTNHIPIDPSSTIAAALDHFSLLIPRPAGRLSSSPSSPLSSTSRLGRGLSLVSPPAYVFRSRVSLAERGDPETWSAGSLDGAFEGLDVVFVRGAKSARGHATVEVVVKEGSVAWASSSARLRGLDAKEGTEGTKGGKVRWEAKEASLQALNVVLASLVYLPSGKACSEGDKMTVKVAFAKESAEGTIGIACA